MESINNIVLRVLRKHTNANGVIFDHKYDKVALDVQKEYEFLLNKESKKKIKIMKALWKE